jgi:hypothetical protein
MQSPRSPSASGRIFRVAVLILPVLLIFAATVLPFALLLGYLRGASTELSDNLRLAILCGLVVWLFLAIFHIRTDTLRLPVADRRGFLCRVIPILEELGYEVTRNGDSNVVSRPGFRALLLGGAIRVQLEGDTARVTGPKVFIEILRRRMRLQSYIDRAQQPPREGRHRTAERLLKRVEVSIRVPGDQGAAAQAEIVGALAREGAKIVCELHVLALSEAGIRETALDELRDVLRQNGITADIRKDFPQWEITAAGSDPRANASPASA